MSPLFQDIDPATLPLRAQAAGLCMGVLILAGIATDVVLLLRLSRRPFHPDDVAKPVRARPWTWHDAVFMLLSLGSLFLVMQVVGALVARHISEWAAEVLMVLQTLIFHAVAVGLVVVLLAARGASWRDGFGLGGANWRQQVARGALYYVAALPLVALYALVSAAYLHAIDYPVEQQDVIEWMTDPTEPWWLRAYLGLLAVATAPIVEELLFRGVALPALARRYGLTFAILAVSFAFAAIHGNAASLAPLFAFACALSIAYVQSGTILVPVVMHALFNTVSLILLFAFKDVLPQTLGAWAALLRLPS
jgi:membrane protease YdiL (CAAX protease family)